MTDQPATTSQAAARNQTRRRVLQLGGLAGGLAVAAPLLGRPQDAAAAQDASQASAAPAGTAQAFREIQKIIRAKGTVSNGILDITIDRDDIPNVHKDGVPIKPAFMINGDVFFQPLGDGSFVMNGDLCFKPEELNPAIDQMIKHGLVFQAEHQHLFSLEPMVWFMHFRSKGSARRIAEGIAAILSATSTPLPQAPPKNPTTPLDAKRLARIIGAPATVDDSGVVNFALPQREPITLGGVRINPYLNVSTTVAFQPLDGHRAVAVPDFGQLAHQVNNCASTMRAQGWQVDCLYNQETDEHPQLFFSHDYKVGNAYELAHEIRRGLEQTSVRFT